VFPQGNRWRLLHVVAAALAIGTWACAAERPSTISEAELDQNGFLVHTAVSPFQSGPTEIKVLLPVERDNATRCPVLYVLPVEAGNGHHFGDGLLEVKNRGLHRRFSAIFVAPTFSQLPWYADHPSDREIRQESHFLEVVVPFIEQRYPARADRDGRLLVGFSKSGWGAYTLLLRHPERFGRAAAWDAPLMEQTPARFGMGPIMGTQENFARYQVTSLLQRRAPELRATNRLILLGYGNFRAQHEQAHTLMVNLRIPHVYRDGPKRPHVWESGWLAEAVELLLSDHDQ
jgi:S-formylglutathione hydrolase FrmB